MRETIKTILFLDHTAKMGGGEFALLNLVRAMDKSRFRCLVALAAEGPLADHLRGAGIETHILPLAFTLRETRKDSLGCSSLFRIREIIRLAAYSYRLARWARQHRVDIIHTNSLKSDLYGGVAGRLSGIPVLWHIRDHINGAYLPPAVAAVFRFLSHVLPQRVIANSASTLGQLCSQDWQSASIVYSGVACEVVHDGYQTQNPSKGSQTLDVRIASEAPTVALIGRIAEWKGQHIFLRAAAAVSVRRPNTRFWIVGAPLFGEQDYERTLHTLTRELGIAGKVEFLGFRDDVAQLLSRIDIVVHASILGEPFGQVVIEGMAAGKPVVATDGGALREIVVPGETGLLVPMGDDAAMADSICTLLADPVRAQAMGEAGRQRVERLFTIQQTARKVEAVYGGLFDETARRQSLLGAGRRGRPIPKVTGPIIPRRQS